MLVLRINQVQYDGISITLVELSMDDSSTGVEPSL